MALLNVIDKTTMEATDLTTGSSNLVLRIPLTSGETIQFTAETQFFTPRKIATSKSDVLGLPSQSVVEYTANNVPVVKMPIGAKDITTPQYYAFSVVSDVYRPTPIDNFFQELTNDLALPDDDPTINTLRDQRDAALQAALALDDLAAAFDAGDPEAFAEANDAINDGLASSILAEEPDPSAVLSPEESDELGALDFVGLTDDYGTTDGADDIIDPTPEILEEDLIQKLPRVAGNKKVKGTEIINQAIDLLNSGIQAVEDSTRAGVNEEGECKFITIAKGKKGFRGIGKKSERKVKRSDIEEKLNKINQEIEKQKATNSPVPGYYKKKTKVGIFAKALNSIQKVASKAGVVGQLLGSVIAAPLAIGTLAESATIGIGTAIGVIPKNTVPMNKSEILASLESAKKKLEDILAKPGDC